MSLKQLLISISFILFTFACLAQSGSHQEQTVPMPDELKTPYKINRYLIKASGTKGAWDETIDCPFVFRHEGRFYMSYLGHDSLGYQTGLASSNDLINWKPEGIILKRDPNNPITRYNIAMSWILRENDVFSDGKLKKINGEYIGSYHAYPKSGFEAGPAVIGICRSKDLRHWTVDPPVLFAEEGAPWEQGGLYKPCLVEEDGTFYIVYNAKGKTTRKNESNGTEWMEQIGVAWSKDLKHWTRYEGNPIIRNGEMGSMDERVAGDPSVYRYGKQWAIFYYCHDDKGISHDRVALSPDLKSATKCEGSLIAPGTKGSIDDSWGCKPSIIYHNGVLYHFYAAWSTNGWTNGICVATSKPIENSTK